MDERGAAKLKPGEEVVGAIPAVDVDLNTMTASEVKLMPWHKAARVGPNNRPNPKVFAESSPVPQHVFEQMQSELPAPVRRTANQRYEVLVKRLMEMGRGLQTPSGVLWPDSLQRILDASGKKKGDLTTQVYTLARHFIVRAENKQRANDAKQTTVGWHGHFD